MGPYREGVPLGNDDLGSPEGESLRNRRRSFTYFSIFFFFSHRPRVIKISSFALKTDFDPLFVLLLLSYFEAFEHNCLAINFWVSGFSLKGFIKNMNISFGGILFTLIRCSFFGYRIEKFLF